MTPPDFPPPLVAPLLPGPQTDARLHSSPHPDEEHVAQSKPLRGPQAQTESLRQTAPPPHPEPQPRPAVVPLPNPAPESRQRFVSPVADARQLEDLFDVSTTGSVTVVCGTNPAAAGWTYLSYATVDLTAASTIRLHAAGSEIAIVPLAGSCTVSAAGVRATLTRRDVFQDGGSVFYTAPGETLELVAETDATVAIGGAPADAVYPTRYIAPNDVRVELRGGGAAHRQVAHLLSPPAEAHRLILYEVHVPRGSWSGWPPHCHDGQDGSPYLEETYYFEHQPTSGFAIHRNFRDATGFDETFIAQHRSLVPVRAGYHSSAACPGSHMYFLNFLAGDLEHDQRRTPPCFDERFTWIDGHWQDHPMPLPTAGRTLG